MDLDAIEAQISNDIPVPKEELLALLKLLDLAKDSSQYMSSKDGVVTAKIVADFLKDHDVKKFDRTIIDGLLAEIASLRADARHMALPSGKTLNMRSVCRLEKVMHPQVNELAVQVYWINTADHMCSTRYSGPDAVALLAWRDSLPVLT